MPLKTPRLSGRRLIAAARLLAAPVAGRRLAEYLMREVVLDRLRGLELGDAEARPVVVFRPDPRRIAAALPSSPEPALAGPPAGEPPAGEPVDA